MAIINISIGFLLYNISSCAVDEKSLLSRFIYFIDDRAPIIFIHRRPHASSKPVIWVKIAFHGIVHIVPLLDLTLPESCRVVTYLLLCVLCLNHRRLEVSFKLVMGGVCMAVSMFIIMIKERVCIKEDLVN